MQRRSQYPTAGCFYGPCSCFCWPIGKAGRLDDAFPPLDEAVVDHLQRWTNTTWLQEGIPLKAPTPEISICTDASHAGWGTHILPSFDSTRGTWTRTETHLHSNHLEMLAVELALHGWEDRCVGSPVPVLSDNSTGGSTSVRRHALPQPLHDSFPPSVVVSIASHGVGGKTHLRPAERPSRLAFQERPALPHGGVPLPSHLPVDQDARGVPYGGPARDEVELQTANLRPPSPDPTAWAVDALSSNWNGLNPSTDPAEPRETRFHPCPERPQLHSWRLCATQSREDTSRMKQWR